MSKRNNLFYVLNILIPLIIGSLIYVFYSPDTYFVRVLNVFIDTKQNVFTKILRNYFCDFCWAYSLAFVLSYIYKESLSIKISIIAPISVGTALELLQLFGIISGTFDLLDIFAELVACIICYLILKRKQGKGGLNI